MSRRKLPILAEHSLAGVTSARVDVSTKFLEAVQSEAVSNREAVTCRPGCAHCCFHPVHVSIFEGLLLYRHLVATGRWTPSFKAKLEEHADSTRDLTFEVWLLSMIACPLLDEKTKRCSVYEARPFACRVTVSTGDPHSCHPHGILESGIKNKVEVTKEFHARQQAAIRRHDITLIIMPLSVALLVSEKIGNGEYDLEGADMAILQEYVESR